MCQINLSQNLRVPLQYLAPGTPTFPAEIFIYLVYQTLQSLKDPWLAVDTVLQTFGTSAVSLGRYSGKYESMLLLAINKDATG